MLVLPRNHPLARKRSLRLKDLSGVRLVVPHDRRPHRIMLSLALQSAGVDWEVAVEANGWELMLHFVELELGLAIVNECCRIPRGLVGRPLCELPVIRYFVFNLPGQSQSPAATLRDILLKYGSSWRRL